MATLTACWAAADQKIRAVKLLPRVTARILSGIARRVDVIVIMCLLDLYASVGWIAAERKQLVQDPIEVRIWRNAER